MSKPGHIPFNKPALVGRELDLMRVAVENMHVSGDGAFTRQASRMLEEAVGGGRVLLTTSCTHALEMAAILCDLGPGDEVIVPSFTFVSGVNAFVLRGAVPVFCDIRPDTLNMDERILESLITSRTKVIAPVHYAGVGCEMDEILEIAGRHGVRVVEDNAHGLFGSYRGKPLGSMGALATQSFHETKNITCGEGGALVINDPSLVERAEIIREKGTDRSRFFRGQVDKYTWVDIGSSYLPSDLLAAYLVSQLEHAAEIQAHRHTVWKRYSEGLRDWSEEHGIRLPWTPSHCEQPAHMFYLLFQTLEDRQSMIAHLREADINAVFHYLPLHSSRMGRHFSQGAAECPVTDRVSDTLLRLPLYFGLTEQDQARVIERLRSWRR